MTNFDRVVGLMGASVVAIACASPAMAQTRSYSIPAQSAASGVAALARQSDQQVLISARDAKGKKTREVRGEMTIEQAFAKLLAGSGLTAKRTGAGAWAVVQEGNAGVDRAEPTQAAASVDVPAASASTVVDARTGAALKGALIEIVETGEKTSTGNLGEFRFPGKTGSYNLRISYLGYPRYEQNVDLKDGRATSGILLSDGSAVGEIVVTAYQSSRAQALNQERTAENVSTVISDDLTGRFDGTTIAEALRRAPGVSFTQNPDTGDGQNIMVRGMSGAFNAITFNGVQLQGRDGVERNPRLDNILADSVSKITINKTLLPSQSGTGTGGLVEIETKSPLDRPAKFISVSADLGRSSGDFLKDESLSGIASFQFGESKNFGVSLSAQYRKQNNQAIQFGSSVLFGKYLPEGAFSIFDVDPRTPFPFEDEAQDAYQVAGAVADTRNSIENFALGASAEWKIADHTTLRVDYSFNSARNKNIGTSFSFSPNYGYMEMPVDELGGDVRRALVSEDYFSPGILVSTSLTGTANDVKDRTSVLTFNGITQTGRWELKYSAGYTKASTDQDIFSTNLSADYANYYNKIISRDYLLQEIANDTTSGKVISLFGPSKGKFVLLPGLTPAGYDFINDTSDQIFQYGSDDSYKGVSERWASSIDIKHTFDSRLLKYLSFGGSYNRTRSAYDLANIASYYPSGIAPLSGLGLNTSPIELGKIGRRGSLNALSIESVLQLKDLLRSRTNPLITNFDGFVNPDASRDFVAEETAAGYVQIFSTLGKFEVIGGVRVENIRNRAVVSYAPTIISATGVRDDAYSLANTNYVPLKASYLNVLPRVVLNFRPSENFVVRAGYFRSIAQPALTAIGASRVINLDLRPNYGPALNQPQLLFISGNPGLKASSTDNLDLSVEWYSADVGVVKAGLFYKPTKRPFMVVERFIEGELPADADLPDDPRFDTPNLFYIVSRPENSPFSAKLWGAEFSIERKFTFLPGWLSGLGVYANYTYTHSSMTVPISYSPAPGGRVYLNGVRYGSQAPHSGTFALTYSRKGLAGTLSYTKQSSYYGGSPRYAIESGSTAVSSLDLKLQYSFKLLGGDSRIYFEAANLLAGRFDPSSTSASFIEATKTTVPSSNAYLGGRKFRLGASVTF